MNDRTEGLSLNFSTNSIRSLRDIEDFVRENNPQIPKHENLTNFRQERLWLFLLKPFIVEKESCIATSRTSVSLLQLWYAHPYLDGRM